MSGGIDANGGLYGIPTRKLINEAPEAPQSRPEAAEPTPKMSGDQFNAGAFRALAQDPQASVVEKVKIKMDDPQAGPVGTVGGGIAGGVRRHGPIEKFRKDDPFPGPLPFPGPIFKKVADDPQPGPSLRGGAQKPRLDDPLPDPLPHQGPVKIKLDDPQTGPVPSPAGWSRSSGRTTRCPSRTGVRIASSSEPTGALLAGRPFFSRNRHETRGLHQRRLRRARGGPGGGSEGPGLWSRLDRCGGFLSRAPVFLP